MKKITLMCLALVLTAHAFAQQLEVDKRQYALKSEKYRNMKRTGACLTIAGGIFLGAGLIIGLNSEEETVYTGNQVTSTSSKGNLQLGYELMVLGGAGLGAGIPLGTIGSKKTRIYNRMESASITIQPQLHHLSLRYSFRFLQVR